MSWIAQQRPDKPKQTPAYRVSRQIRTAGQAGRVATAAQGQQGYLVNASYEEAETGTRCSFPANGLAYSVLSLTGASTDSSDSSVGRALNPAFQWPCGAPLVITNPRTGQSVTATHADDGAGSDSNHPTIGLYARTLAALGLPAGESSQVVISATTGTPTLAPLRVLGSGTAGAGGTTTTTTTKIEPYEFTRGSQGQRESSWDAMGRLAEEVAWSRWVEANALIYASDDELRAAQPSLLIDGTEEWLRTIPQWGWSPNRTINKLTLDVVAERWGVQIGAVVEIRMGLAVDGIYLVTETHGTMVAPELQVVLARPAPKKLEPAPQTTTTTSTISTGGFGSVTGDTAASKLYNACVAISNQNRPYSAPGERHFASVTPSGGMDCSGSTCYALWLAGLYAGDDAVVSGELQTSWGHTQQGPDYTVWANPEHVWIEFYGQQYSRFDTRDGPGPRMHADAASDQSRFTPRHA